MAKATYKLQIDWNNNGSYSTGEDATTDVRVIPGITTVRGKDQLRSLAPPAAGRFNAELDNTSRRYSPENSTSDLAGNLVPGRTVQLQTTYNSSTNNLWTGYLDDLQNNPEPKKRSVTIPALAGLSRLADKTISTQLYQNIRTDEAIGYILDAVGWSTSLRDLSTSGRTTLKWWWLNNENAFDAARAVVNTEGPGASLYEDGSGNITYEDRHYRLTQTRATASQATFRDTATEPLHHPPLRYNPGLKDIINRADLTVVTRSAKATSVVWTLGETVTLAASQTAKYTASNDSPFQSAITPVASTDYTVTAGSISSLTLDRTSGQSVTITITAGTGGATITGLQLRAALVSVDYTNRILHTVSSTASESKYGVKPYTLSVRQDIDVSVGIDLANAIVGLYQEPRATADITVINGSSQRLTQSLTREISDRITIQETQSALSDDFWIERVQHDVREGGNVHITTFGCEQVAGTGNFLVLDSTTLGLIDSGKLGF